MAFDYHQVHNMLALMLDPYYKSLWVVEKHVGCGNAIPLASKYHFKEVIPLLIIIFERLNPFIQAKVVVSIDGFSGEEEETNMFGVGAFVEKSSWILIIRELSLFWRVAIPPSMCANPLIWWKTHESQFSNVGFFIKQVFGILSFQIETKGMFNLASVLTTLKCYCLQVQNLNWITIIINNWLNPC